MLPSSSFQPFALPSSDLPSFPDPSTTSPSEIADYLRRHYVLIKTKEGYILGRNARFNSRGTR